MRPQLVMHSADGQVLEERNVQSANSFVRRSELKLERLVSTVVASLCSCLTISDCRVSINMAGKYMETKILKQD